MNPKLLYGFIAVLFVGFAALVVVSKQSETPRPGVAHADEGRKHVEQKNYSESEVPTSGDHASPVAWGVYDTEQRDDQLIHNLEHGGIVVTYRPDIPTSELSELKRLLLKPYSEPKFAPTKIVLAPRPANKEKIVLSSWQRSQSLDVYDKGLVINYVKRNLGKSPEPLAG